MTSITLADLCDSWDRVSQLRPDEANCRRLTEQISNVWNQEGVLMSDIVTWSLERLELPLDGNFTVADVEQQFLKKRLQFKILMYFIKEVPPNWLDDDPDWVDVTSNIDRTMSILYKSLHATFCLYNQINSSRRILIQSNVMDQESFLFHNPDALTSFQKLLLYILFKFEAKRYLKCGDSCFARELTLDGRPTY